MFHSWLSPDVEVRPAGLKGSGLFATNDIAAGTIVTGFGGHVVALGEFQQLPEHQQTHSLQIAENLFMVCPDDGDPADLFNHSCEPNLGLLGNVMLVTMGPIATGEELTFDYAMCDTDSYDEFECQCGATNCRRKVTGNDWMNRDLQTRYRGYFSTYLERRIADLEFGSGELV